MMKALITLVLFSSIALMSFRSSPAMESEIEEKIQSIGSSNSLKEDALHILETKCNVCHKKQNPFMVFKEKNMEKKAPKINQMVFIERRMPKGNEIKLTKEEYTQLKNWLASLNIY